jgi:hypothetical protein
MRVYFVEANHLPPRSLGHAAEGNRVGEAFALHLAGSGSDFTQRRTGALSAATVPRLSLLLSFHYYRDQDVRALLDKYLPGIAVNLFADSGAFSALSSGEPIVLREYAAWLRRNAGAINVYSNLDVIGDPEASAANMRELEAEGLAPLPVFHFGSDFKYLDAITERYEYVALGGMVANAKDPQVLGRWLRECYKRARGARFHGFGLTNWDLMRAFEWRSVDSSSWSAVFRFGGLSLFDPDRGQFMTVETRTVTSVMRHARLIRQYGFSPQELLMTSKRKSERLAVLSLLSWLAAERWLNERSAA